jgi:hypothetical protein
MINNRGTGFEIHFKEDTMPVREKMSGSLLIITMLIFLCMGTARGRGLTGQDIPAPVQNTFQKSYPNAKKARWSIKKGNYRVTFKDNKKKITLSINPGGQVVRKKTKIKIPDFPQQYKKELAEKYPGFTLKKAAKIEEKGMVFYIARLYRGKQELKITFNTDGTISKVKEGDDKRYQPQVYGYIQSRFRYPIKTGDDGLVDNSDFRVQRVRIGVKGKVNPSVDYEVDIDPRAPDITTVLRDAVIGIKIIPLHKILFGQQKTIFGYENMVSSSRLYVVNRTELSDNLARGVNLRDIGVGLAGKIPIGSKWMIEDGITLTNGAGMNVQDDDTPKKNVWGRIGMRRKTYGSVFRWGFSGAYGDMMDEGDSETDPDDDYVLTFKRYGFDVEFENRWFLMNAEAAIGFDTFTNPNGIDGNGVPEKETDDFPAYYITLVGKTPWNMGLIFRFDAFSDEYIRYTFGAYYGESSDKFRILLNYELRQKMEQASGEIGRGDDKVYLWCQAKF